MHLQTIDHIVIAVEDVAKAREPLERLGLTLTPVMTHGDGATRNTVFFAGNETTEFYVELLGLADPEAASTSPRAQALKRTLERGGGAHSIMLSTEDLAAARRDLAVLPGGFDETTVTRADGSVIATVLRPADASPAGCPFGIIAYAERLDVRRARHRDAGLFANPLGLRRMDHLAAVVHDIEGATRVWDSVLGVPVFGQVRGTGMVIQQMKVGDAILEFLGPDGPESRILQRPPGLATMAAFEVADIQAAVAHARSRGFSPGDPGPGPLPGTHVATIPAIELGFGLQLLQYV